MFSIVAESSRNVLRVNKAEEATQYREAVAKIILNIQNKFDATHEEISDNIDVCLKTITNAAGKKGELSVTFLKRLGECYGAEMLDPYAALIGARMVPLRPVEDDPMPHLLALATALSQAQAEGKSHDHRVKLAMVPELKAAQSAITNLLIEADRIAS